MCGRKCRANEISGLGKRRKGIKWQTKLKNDQMGGSAAATPGKAQPGQSSNGSMAGALWQALGAGASRPCKPHQMAPHSCWH